MAKTYYWLRLKENFFKSLAMKKLRRIAGGDTYTIIYLKLQLLSLKDEGYLYFEGVENNMVEELALALDEDEENVSVTLNYLMNVGLLRKINDNDLYLTEVPMLIGKETDKAELMRKKRARERENRLENGNNVTNELPPVTERYTEIEIEIEKEKEREIEIETEKRERVNYQQIADMYNETCVSFPRLKALSDARKKAIKARLKTYSLADFQLMFEKAEASDFLKGKNNRNWSATFDWMLKDANMAKILDGNYDNHGSGQTTKSNRTAQELDEAYDMMAHWAQED